MGAQSHYVEDHWESVLLLREENAHHKSHTTSLRDKMISELLRGSLLWQLLWPGWLVPRLSLALMPFHRVWLWVVTGWWYLSTISLLFIHIKGPGTICCSLAGEVRSIIQVQMQTDELRNRWTGDTTDSAEESEHFKGCHCPGNVQLCTTCTCDWGH